MKKIAAILLSVLMLSTAACASAQTTATLTSVEGKFDIVLTYEEPLTLTQEEAPESYVYCTAEREGLAAVSISIAPSELTEGLSMADLGEEGQSILMAMSASQYLNPITEVCTTPSGNMYLSICSNEELEVDTLFTLYKGYFVQLTQYDFEDGKLTDEDKAFCLDMLYGIEFIEK